MYGNVLCQVLTVINGFIDKVIPSLLQFFINYFNQIIDGMIEDIFKIIHPFFSQKYLFSARLVLPCRE